MNYQKVKENPNLLLPKNKYDLADVALLTKQTLKQVKADYRRGLNLLVNLIQCYDLITKYESEDFSEYYCKFDIEGEWKKVSKFFQYIPYIGVDEYMIIRKYNPELLNFLKLKGEFKNVNPGTKAGTGLKDEFCSLLP